MKTRGIIKLAAAAVLAAAGAASVAPASFAAESGGTLKKIADSGTVAIGYRESSIPFAYLDDAQKPVGYSIDLCAKIVDRIGQALGREVQVRYVPVNPKTRIPLLANGTIDLECGATTNNLTRQQQVAFLPTTFITGTKLLVRKDGGIQSVKDLEGKSIALPQGTTNERAIQEQIAKLGLNVRVLPVKEHAEGMLALETGRVDAYSTDHILLAGLISKSRTPDAYAVVGDFLSFDPYAIMVRRDDSAFELVGRQALSELFRSGEIDAIYAKWFDPLGVAQTDLLQAAFRIQAFPE